MPAQGIYGGGAKAGREFDAEKIYFLRTKTNLQKVQIKNSILRWIYNSLRGLTLEFIIEISTI